MAAITVTVASRADNNPFFWRALLAFVAMPRTHTPRNHLFAGVDQSIANKCQNNVKYTKNMGCFGRHQADEVDDDDEWALEHARADEEHARADEVDDDEGAYRRWLS